MSGEEMIRMVVAAYERTDENLSPEVIRIIEAGIIRNHPKLRDYYNDRDRITPPE